MEVYDKLTGLEKFNGKGFPVWRRKVQLLIAIKAQLYVLQKDAPNEEEA